MLISIVIPAYNEEKYLKGTLKSVFDQKISNFDFEVIVVDSGSTDKTSEIAKNFGVKVIKTIKKTPAFARQQGVKASRGEIIVCLDADTFLPKDHLSTIIREFNKDKKIVGITGFIDAWGGNWFQRLLYKWSNIIFITLSFLLGKPGFQGQSFAFKKEAFEKVGGFKEEIYTCEDMDLGYRMTRIGKIKLLPKITGISSVRRIKEGSLFTNITRGFFSYLKLLWGFPLNKEKQPFSSVR